MPRNKQSLRNIFEGYDLPEDFQEKIIKAFDEALNEKVKKYKKIYESTSISASDAKAILDKLDAGKESFWDLADQYPALGKHFEDKSISMGKRGDDDMEEVERAVIADLEKMTAMEEISYNTKKQPNEDEDEVQDLSEQDLLDKYTPEKIRELLTDINMVRLLNAADEERSKFFNSMRSAITDLTGNKMAEPFLNFIMNILSVVASDTRISTMISNELDSKEKTTEPIEGEEIQSDEEVEIYESLIESVDKYLTYIGEAWIKENEVAVDQGLKVEIMESFWNGLKSMYTDHNIVLPEETNIVEDLKSKIADLEQTIVETKENYESQLNEEIKKSIQFKKDSEGKTKNLVIESISKNLSLTQKEKFEKLIKDVVFENETQYTNKLKTIVETAFTNNKKSSNGDSLLTEEDTNNKPVDSRIELYSKLISKNQKF
jgi:hypothetical protein